MKKAALTAVGILTAASLLTGCGREEVEKAIQPLIAEVQEEKTENTAEMEAQEETVSTEIDTTIPIQAGARVAVVSKNTKGEFWTTLRKGMEAAIQEVNVAYGFKKDEQVTMTFEGPDDEQDVETQINILDAVIAENPDVLCLSAGDVDSCQAQLETAKENGIPVVVFDSNVSERKLIRAYRGTDNKQVGQMAAYKMGSALGKMGKVAVFSAQQKTQSARDRAEGFLNAIANYSDIEVVDVVFQDEVEDMEAAMQQVLEQNPVLDGVFCTNADVAEMYLDMEKDETRKIAMVGVDATTRQIEAIQDGEELGLISQDPYAMGYETIWTALKATAPKKAKVEITKAVMLEPAWINIENLENPEYSNYIYNTQK